MEGIVNEETAVGTSATATQAGSEEEQKLVEEIMQLRAVLAESRNTARKTKGEAKAILERLTGRLHELKQVRLFVSASAMLRKKLATPALAYDFLRWYVSSFNLANEQRDDGIIVLDPNVEVAESSFRVAEPSTAVPLTNTVAAAASEGESDAL